MKRKCLKQPVYIAICNLPYLNLQQFAGITHKWSKMSLGIMTHYTKMVLNSLVPETKIDEFTNSVGLGEVAHDEAPHLDLHCLPCSL